jgi:hypothetical protein
VALAYFLLRVPGGLKNWERSQPERSTPKEIRSLRLSSSAL